MAVKLVPVNEYKWDDDYSYLRKLTCKNHQTAEYLTKNPWQRGLHVIKVPTDAHIERSSTGECTCSFGDLVVIVEDAESKAAERDAAEIEELRTR
jgi:hypothetical protein